MTIELLFNVVMLVFFGYCYFYIGATLPASGSNELGAEQWPQIVLVLLVISLALNIYKITKGLKAAPAEDRLSLAKLKTFFTGKLFIGILTIFTFTLLLDHIGFIPSCVLFIIAYSRLLGEKRWLINLISGLVIAILLYFIFAKGLSIMLPRGDGIFRSFALLLETF